MFWAPCGSGVGGDVWMLVGDAWGMPPTDVHMHAHACTCVCGKHNFMQMAAPIGGIPGNSLWCHMHMHMCACTCMCMCVGAPSHHPPTNIYPPPRGDPQNQSKFNSTWTNRDISIPFEDLKSVETFPSMGRCIGRWVGGWVGGLMGGVRSKH